MKKSLAFFLALFIFAGCLPSHAAGLVWNPIPKKLSVMLRGEDLLKGLRAKTHIDYPSQKSDMTIYSDTRSVSLTLKYTLGKMNRKNKKEIDSSRFGQ